MRVLLLIFLILVGWLQPARAEEPHTFWGKTVEGWIAVFRDQSSTEVQRRQAVVALACFGPEAKAAVPDLIEAVRKGPFRDEAVGALTLIGAGADVTVPVLIDRLLKRGCQNLLGWTSFADTSSLVRIGGPAVPALVEILNGPNRDRHVCAAGVLWGIGPAARGAVPSLIRVIERFNPEREDEAVQYAIKALGRIGPEARAAIPALNRLLDSGYGFDAVLALDRIGAPPVRKLLDCFLREGDPSVGDLASLGPRAREAVPALRASLTDKRAQVRISAAVALANIEPSATESIPVLIQALKPYDVEEQHDEELDVGEVPGALAQLGPRAKAALPALIGLVKKEPEFPEFLTTMVQIDPEGTECVPVLIEAVKREDYEFVDAAAKCLGLLGPRAEAAVPALAKTVTRDFPDHFFFCELRNPQVSAAEALRRIDPRGKSAIPVLIRALKHRRIVRNKDGTQGRDSCVAAAAAQVLGSFGTQAKAAVPSLIEEVRLREDFNRDLRRAAIVALGQIGPEAKAAVPVLRDVMEEDEKKSYCYTEALIALCQLASDGKDVAERWLNKPSNNWMYNGMRYEFERRTMVLSAMGRTSFEGDFLTRRFLEGIEWKISNAYPGEQYEIDFLEEWIEGLGRLGIGARSAVPRLNELRDHHPNPWVRMRATEALERIIKVPPAKVDETR